MKSAPKHHMPVWRKLLYRRLAKAPSSDFVERVLVDLLRKGKR